MSQLGRNIRDEKLQCCRDRCDRVDEDAKEEHAGEPDVPELDVGRVGIRVVGTMSVVWISTKTSCDVVVLL